MVLDLYVNQLMDAPYMNDMFEQVLRSNHPLVMATTTSSTSHSSTSSVVDSATSTAKSALGFLCDYETFASYCTFTKDANGNSKGTISDAKAGELIGIVLVVMIAIFLYLLIAIVGAIVFPPLVICLAMESGDLNNCTGGLYT